MTIDNYTFVYEPSNKGWWLKIDSVEKLIDYHQKTEKLYADCLIDYMHHADEYKKTGNYSCFDNIRTVGIVMFAEKRSLTIIDAIIQFRLDVSLSQLNYIHDYGAIAINKVGGYHFLESKDYTEFVNRKGLIWPDFKMSDIRISQFPGGQHWYIHIGDVELRNGTQMKWDNREEAYNYAKSFVKEVIE